MLRGAGCVSNKKAHEGGGSMGGGLVAQSVTGIVLQFEMEIHYLIMSQQTAEIKTRWVGGFYTIKLHLLTLTGAHTMSCIVSVRPAPFNLHASLKFG